MAYILPETLTTPVYGEALEDVFQSVVVGVTGLAPQLVRPRFQPEPPNLPDFSTNWAALGFSGDGTKDKFAYVVQIDAFTTQLERDETLQVLFSFYGPRCQELCEMFVDGIQLAPNRADLHQRAGCKLVEMKNTRQLPVLMKEKWLKRFDVAGIFRRRVKRIYKGNAIAQFDGVDLHNEYYITRIPANSNPTP